MMGVPREFIKKSEGARNLGSMAAGEADCG